MLACLPSLLADQPVQSGRGRLQDAGFPQELLGLRAQGGRLFQAAAFLEQEVLQEVPLSSPERAEPEVGSNLDLMLGDRLLPLAVPVDLVGIDAQLGAREGQQLVDDLEGMLGGEPVGQADEDDLVGEPQAVVVAATLLDLFQVLRGQSRLGDEPLARERREGRWIGHGRCPGKRAFDDANEAARVSGSPEGF